MVVDLYLLTSSLFSNDWKCVQELPISSCPTQWYIYVSFLYKAIGRSVSGMVEESKDLPEIEGTERIGSISTDAE